jgi:hypothetical protein
MATRSGSTRTTQANKTQPTRSGRQSNSRQEVSEVHEARSRQQASKTSSKPAANNQQNGTGRRGNARKPEVATVFWPLDLVSVTYLAARDSDGKKDLDIVACGRCAALLVESPSSKKAHESFHRLIDGLDTAVAR